MGILVRAFKLLCFINQVAKVIRYCAVADESQAPPAGHPPTFGGEKGT